MSSDKEEIIKEIKIYMINNDLNQQEMADLVGISRQWFNFMLNCKCDVSKEVLDIVYYEDPHQAEIDAISEIQNEAIAEYQD